MCRTSFTCLLALMTLLIAPQARAGGKLEVISMLPVGEVAHLTQVTVRFSEPVKPLGVMEASAENSPLVLLAEGTSVPPGSFRWLDPATLAYLFDSPVDVPLSLEARVKKGTTALSGATLENDVAWRLNTPKLLLELEDTGPLPKTGAELHLTGNYALDAGSLAAKSRLQVNGKDLRFTLREHAYPHYGNAGRQTRWRYVYAVEEPLPPDSTVILTLDKGAALQTNRAGTRIAAVPGMRFERKTYGRLRVESWNAGVREDGKSPMRPDENLFVRFNNPVSLKDLLQYIEVSPPAPLREDLEIETEDAGFSHVLPFRWAPRTKYALTLKPGLTDSFGTTLTKESRFRFSTGDYAPFFALSPGVFMEPSLDGIVYMDLRNYRRVAVSMVFVPWDSPGAFLAYSGESEPDMAAKSLTVETTLDFSGQPNTNIRRAISIPELFRSGTPVSGRETASGQTGQPLQKDEANTTGSPAPATNRATGLLADRRTDLPDLANRLADLADRAERGALNGFVRLSVTPYETGQEQNPRTEERTLQITPIALTVKASRGTGQDSGLALATDLESGTPLSGVRLAGFDWKGNALWQGETGPDGTARLPGNADLSLLKAEKNGATCVSALSQDRLRQTFFDHVNRNDRERMWNGHMVAQLPLYQPGQTVNFTVFAKVFTDTEKDGNGTERLLPFDDWRPVAGETLTLLIRDSRGETVHSQEAVSNAYGSFAGSFTLPSSANLGQYRMALESPRFTRRVNARAFQVASFRPPDFKVDITAPEDRPKPLPQDGPLHAALHAEYFSGASLPGAASEMRIDRFHSGFAPSRLAGYATGADPGLFWRIPGQGQAVEPSFTLRATLDAKGNALFTLPDPDVEPGRPQRVELGADVTDITGLVSQGAASFMLHPAGLYAGIRAPRVAPPGKDIFIELKAATWDDKPVPSATVRLEAVRELRNGESEKAWEKALLLDTPNGRPFAVRFEKSGRYTLNVWITDPQGRENMARTTVYVPGPDMEWISLRGDGTLELLADKERYAPGETAVVMINNPFEEALALVTTERQGVKTFHTVTVSGPAPTVEIPLSRDDAPYVFATVTLIRGRTAPAPQGSDAEPGHDLGSPRAAFGAVSLVVDAKTPELAVRVATDKPEYRPGGTVKASALVTDTDGKPRRAQVTLLAVDERILRAAGETDGYDPRATFRKILSYGVANADTRVRLLNISRPLQRDTNFMTRSRMMAPSTAAPAAQEMAASAPNALTDTAAGGENGATLRENFSPLAFWLGQGETDEAGRLAVSFTLPDTLTSYRIVALAADARNGFATDETSVKAAKPLQLVSAMPRFLTEGDALEARILVQNMSGQRAAVRVRAEGEGVLFENVGANADEPPGEKTRNGSGGPEREITLSAGESGRVAFPLRAGEAGTAVLTLRGTMALGGVMENDALRVSIPILPKAPMTTVAAAGLLGERENFVLPVQTPLPLDPRSSLELRLAASPAAGLDLVADELLLYPWHCLEQRFSRAWARILRLRHGEMLAMSPAADDRAVIAETLDMAGRFQHDDGGFSLWPGMSRSNYYLTAYVLLVNREAAALGLSLPRNVEERALGYLTRRLKESVGPTKAAERWTAVDAMALLVLADKDATLATASYPALLERAEKEKTNPMTWGVLLLASKTVPGLPEADAYRSRIIRELEKSAAVTPTQTHFAGQSEYGMWMTMGSTLRDNGMVLGALAAVMPDYPRLESLAHWVGQGLGETQTLSTQEAVFGLQGLASYLLTLDPDGDGNGPVTVQASWNDAARVTKHFTRLVEPEQSWTLGAKTIAAEGESRLELRALDGRPYWTARLRYASPSLPVRPENAGFTVNRTWLTPGPWKMGDTVDVAVTLTVPATRRHVLLFDPFPAGLEPLHASRADLMDRETRYQSPWQFQETRDDGMLLYAEQVNPGVYTYTYTLRAAAPGEFIQRPTRVEEMYTPEVFGRTGGGLTTVLP